MEEGHLRGEDVLKVARLARLALDEEEVTDLQRDLEDVLRYVEKLEALDTSGVEPLTHPVPLVLPLRHDVVEEPLEREDLLANAPDHDGASFRVPKVVAD